MNCKLNYRAGSPRLTRDKKDAAARFERSLITCDKSWPPFSVLNWTSSCSFMDWRFSCSAPPASAFQEAKREENPGVLGLFAVVHGVGEWLDSTALIISDSPDRGGPHRAHDRILMEFVRRNAIRFGLKLQGRWLYPPLVLLVAFGGFRGGLSTAGDLARYAIGFVGATARTKQSSPIIPPT
jgi:hypothetical protein